jgi:hypothetical protein
VGDGSRSRLGPVLRAPAQDLKAPLPVDSSVRTGTLPNGLKFFIRRNPRPENRVLLRLAVKAGSVDEAEDQRGLAHVLEHMAFNGTARFKPGELVNYLQSIGARFGRTSTPTRATTRPSTCSTSRPIAERAAARLRRAERLCRRHDAGPEEVDKERGVVIEEWRGRLGAGTRMQQPQIEAIFGPTSQYSKRLPIGTPESLRTFTVKRLRDFYTANYRANRMAVIAVGDLDPADDRDDDPAARSARCPARAARERRESDSAASRHALRHRVRSRERRARRSASSTRGRSRPGDARGLPPLARAVAGVSDDQLPASPSCRGGPTRRSWPRRRQRHLRRTVEPRASACA